MKKDIYFEKDLFALRLRIILLLILCVLLNLPLTTLLYEKNNSINWKLILTISIVFTMILLIFMTHTIEITENRLIFKNIYRLKIKELNLKTNYSRKISKKNNDKPGAVLWNIFGKKYARMINIKFELNNKRKKINLNGQILTQKGLEKLIANTKKKNIC